MGRGGRGQKSIRPREYSSRGKRERKNSSISGAPAIEDSLRSLQEQVAALQKQLEAKNENLVSPSLDEPKNWQPAKRMVAWQPMKRNVDDRAPLLHAIEARLSEVLRAGERLGVSADEVLADLRIRNQIN